MKRESIVIGTCLLLILALGIPQLGFIGSLVFIGSTLIFVAGIVLLAWILTKIFSKGT